MPHLYVDLVFAGLKGLQYSELLDMTYQEILLVKDRVEELNEIIKENSR